MPKKLTNKEFIKRSIEIHGRKYNYSQTEYKGSGVKIKIICKIHGVFEQRAINHLSGYGCKKCANIKRNVKLKNSFDEFVANASKIHNDKYDYPLNNYINNNTKIKISCPTHGFFFQKPKDHIYGKGCPKCHNLNKTTEDFVKQAKKVHDNKYNYEVAIYEKYKKKIKIICSEHGLFEQTPTSHLSGKGCYKCTNKFMDTEKFIKKAKKIHNNKFSYKKSIYIISFKKVEIICPIHDSFFQRPDKHIQGDGCPKCKYSKGEKFIAKILETQNIKNISQYKFQDCKNKNHLPFDFYLKNENICVEFYGEQHFAPLEYFGGMKKFITQIERDKIKKKYCKTHNIPLIIILKKTKDSKQLVFADSFQNASQKLKNILKKGNVQEISTKTLSSRFFEIP